MGRKCRACVSLNDRADDIAATRTINYASMNIDYTRNITDVRMCVCLRTLARVDDAVVLCVRNLCILCLLNVNKLARLCGISLVEICAPVDARGRRTFDVFIDTRNAFPRNVKSILQIVM